MKTKQIAFKFLLMFVLLFWQSVNAQDPKREYLPQRTAEPPAINGVLDDLAWEQGIWETSFTQHEPKNGLKPTQHTEFCILFDDNYLYVAFRAYDTSPDSIVTRLTRRDNDDGDFVGIGIDSYYDLRTAFILGVTAGGTRFDFIASNDGQNNDFTWDPNWRARTSVNENGWEAEMRIPLSQLRFKKNGNTTWGLQIFRRIHRSGELSFWQPIPADAPGLVHRFGLLKGMNEIYPRQIFDISPYVVTSGETYLAQKGNPFMPGKEGHIKTGLDAKIGITNNFTLDLTINPDFGQVEADPSEVNLTAFESFFQEKRPFFIEGRNISSFSLGIGDGGLGNDDLFYSRRIGRRPTGHISINGDAWLQRPSFTNILGAAKLTGKTQQGLSVAVIHSVTAQADTETDLHGERTNYMIEPLTSYFVSRIQQDFDDGNRIVGGIFTGTNRKLDENLSQQMHSQAYTGGLDYTQYFRKKSWMFNINAAFSHVAGSEDAMLRTQRSAARYFQRPDNGYIGVDSTRTSLSGTGGRVQLLKTGSGHWRMMGAVLWKSPQFEINDIGFMRESDNIFQVLWAGYRQWQPRGIYRSYNININQYHAWNFGGQLAMGGVNMNGFISYRNFWSSNAGVEYNYSLRSTTLLRGGPSFKQSDKVSTWFGSSTDSRKNLVFNLYGNYALGLENSYDFLRISPSVTYKPFDNFNFSFNPSYSTRNDKLQYVSQTPYNHEMRYVFATINQSVMNFSFRINYTITPDLTLQYWGQPFIASGKYHDFKHITDPNGNSFSERFRVFAPDQISQSDGRYMVDEKMVGNKDYDFRNPDFKVREFLSNLVLRWEFNPGSSLYFVWSQTRSGYESNSDIQYFNDLDSIFSIAPHNVFLVKLSYRIGVKG